MQQIGATLLAQPVDLALLWLKKWCKFQWINVVNIFYSSHYCAQVSVIWWIQCKFTVTVALWRANHYVTLQWCHLVTCDRYKEIILWSYQEYSLWRVTNWHHNEVIQKYPGDDRLEISLWSDLIAFF